MQIRRGKYASRFVIRRGLKFREICSPQITSIPTIRNVNRNNVAKVLYLFFYCSIESSTLTTRTCTLLRNGSGHFSEVKLASHKKDSLLVTGAKVIVDDVNIGPVIFLFDRQEYDQDSYVFSESSVIPLRRGFLIFGVTLLTLPTQTLLKLFMETTMRQR